MNNKEQINKLIEEALNSVDPIKQAKVKSYLLTRINARMNRETETAWEKAGWFIGRPAVAFTGLCMILLINVIVFMYNNSSTPAVINEQAIQTPADEFSYTVATIYDFENSQP